MAALKTSIIINEMCDRDRYIQTFSYRKGQK